jgi:hypothetical protein
MNRALLNRVLQGDADAIQQFAESDHCVVVDWKDGLREIVAAVAGFLPKGSLRLESQGSNGSRLVRSDGTGIDASATSAKPEELLLLVNRALAPRFELRQFRPFDGDGYSLLVAPTELWAELDRAQPEAIERYFLGVERLAAYRKKGFVARLFSKP